MSKFLLAALLGALAVFAGCGGGDGSSSSASAAKPESLLMTLDELPKGSGLGESPPELCGPIPVFEHGDGQSALSSSFLVGQTRLVEAVGVFRTPTQAKLAYEGLNQPKRLACISNAIDSFGSASSVKVSSPKSIDFGEEGTLVRYLALDESAKTKGFSDVISIRDGRCTVALLLATEGGNPSESNFEPASETAVDRLSDACGQRLPPADE
jgi:hypothetical protein